MMIALFALAPHSKNFPAEHKTTTGNNKKSHKDGFTTTSTAEYQITKRRHGETAVAHLSLSIDLLVPNAEDPASFEAGLCCPCLLNLLSFKFDPPKAAAICTELPSPQAEVMNCELAPCLLFAGKHRQGCGGTAWLFAGEAPFQRMQTEGV